MTGTLTRVTDLPRRLSYVPLEAVRPAERNPKMHDHQAIIASILTYGWTNPLLNDERTGRIVAGHGRLAALVEINARGLPAPAGIVVDDDGQWLVPMLRGWSSHDDTEAEAYIIADNRLTEAGDWHQQTLAAMLEDINAAEPELFETLAYTADQLDELLRRADGDGSRPLPTATTARPTRRSTSPAAPASTRRPASTTSTAPATTTTGVKGSSSARTATTRSRPPPSGSPGSRTSSTSRPPAG